jgi:hypothetical protein
MVGMLKNKLLNNLKISLTTLSCRRNLNLSADDICAWHLSLLGSVSEGMSSLEL